MKNPNANVVRAKRTKKANVPADLHELLSTAKNRPEMNIRIYLIRLLPISCSKTLTLTNVELRFQCS